MKHIVVPSFVAALVVVSCVIAEPPAEIPKLPEYRPIIVKSSVIPTAGRVLTEFPPVFVVPVELVDPTVRFSWRAYVDYDFAGRSAERLGLVASGTSTPDAARSRIRNLEIRFPPPSDLQACHVIQVIVANRFQGAIEGRPAHTPEAPGGDTIEWFYNPSGDFSGCPTQDPVINPIPEGGLDAADGGKG